MTWTSSPKDSILGLSLLSVIGGSVAGSIAASSWSAARDTEYRVDPAWATVGIVVFFGAAYAALYAVNGLLHRVWSSYTRRAGPAISAALETAGSGRNREQPLRGSLLVRRGPGRRQRR